MKKDYLEIWLVFNGTLIQVVKKTTDTDYPIRHSNFSFVPFVLSIALIGTGAAVFYKLRKGKSGVMSRLKSRYYSAKM